MEGSANLMSSAPDWTTAVDEVNITKLLRGARATEDALCRGTDAWTCD